MSDKFKTHDRFSAGTAKLLAERRPGQTFSAQEIADACGVHKRTVQYIEAKALRNFARGLQALCPDVINDEMSAGKREGFLRTLNTSPYDRSKPTALTLLRRDARHTHFARARLNVGGEASVESTNRKLREADPVRYTFSGALKNSLATA